MSTPIRTQYLELKRRYPGTILFFRLGDFYETFDEDAHIAARELQITLTSKPMGKDLRVPLAGVPYHSIDGHVAKLVAAGHRVAICEQLADPATVKGLVPRDVVRVVTAGTITADGALDPAAPNELAAWVARGDQVAVALADVTTGELRVACGAEAAVELGRAAPAELLVEEAFDGPEPAEPGLAPPAVACPLRRRPPLSELAATAEVAAQFGEAAPATLVESPAERAALAQLVVYLRETYDPALGALQRVRRVSAEALLNLDARTLRNLDVLPQPGRASLYGVLNRTRSPMGARLLRAWLVRPLRDPEQLALRHDALGWALANPIVREQAQAVLGGVPDVARILGRVGAASASPRDVHALRTGLRATRELGVVLGRVEAPPMLAGALAAFAALDEPLALLESALDDDPPATFDEGGVIRSGFSPEVDSLRELTRDARGYLLGLERLERERTGIRSLKVGHNRVFGYYIEVSTANAALVPSHFQRRQTLTGAERYVTEELKEYESRLVGARDRLVELERQAFASLVATLAAHLADLQTLADAVARCDVVLALAGVASERGYVRPAFNMDRRLAITRGRHPVVEAALGPGRFVPNDCDLDGGARQILLLTGPNMSGKSTFLRQVALIALMAQAGSFVPAASAELPLFDRIFTRVGAQDDLAAGQSTFMVEMVETAVILHQATPASLVILDEVGRGTSTFDGMAIARAVVEFIHNRREVAALTLFATHYHELTALADILPRVDNAHVAVHEDGSEVVFEHRIAPGPSDRSYGIHVARLAGLPAAVIARANSLLVDLETGRAAPERGSASPEDPAGSPLQVSFLVGPSPAERALAAVDPDALSPLEALQKLYELRALACPVQQPAPGGPTR